MVSYLSTIPIDALNLQQSFHNKPFKLRSPLRFLFDQLIEQFIILFISPITGFPPTDGHTVRSQNQGDGRGAGQVSGCHWRRRNLPARTDGCPGCSKQCGRVHDGSYRGLGAGTRGGRDGQRGGICPTTSEMAGEVGALPEVVAAGVGGGTVGDRWACVLPGAVGDGRRARKTANVPLRSACCYGRRPDDWRCSNG